MKTSKNDTFVLETSRPETCVNSIWRWISGANSKYAATGNNSAVALS